MNNFVYFNCFIPAKRWILFALNVSEQQSIVTIVGESSRGVWDKAIWWKHLMPIIKHGFVSEKQKHSINDQWSRKSSQKLRSQNDLESDHTIVLTHFHCRSIVSRFNGWKNCMLRIAIVKLIKINLQFQRFPQHSSIWNESEIFAWNEFRIFIVVRWYRADYAVLTAECLIGFSYNCLHFLSPVCCELRLVADRIWFSHEKHN